MNVGRTLAIVVLASATLGPAEALKPDPHRLALRVALPTGQVATAIEGEHEPRSTGSYALRIYAPSDPQFPQDRFVAGVVRPRDGTLEDLRVDDVDRDGQPEVLVLVRNAGSGGFLQVDAYTITNDGPTLVVSLHDLPHDAVPEREIDTAWRRAHHAD